MERNEIISLLHKYGERKGENIFEVVDTKEKQDIWMEVSDGGDELIEVKIYGIRCKGTLIEARVYDTGYNEELYTMMDEDMEIVKRFILNVKNENEND